MGAGIARRIAKHMPSDTGVIAYDRDPALAQALPVTAASSIADVVSQLDPAQPRVVWVMLPDGDPTQDALREVAELLRTRHPAASADTRDIVIDGGNSHYKDTIAAAQEINSQHIELIDVGTSGGIWGEARGFCLTVGGSSQSVGRLMPLFSALAPADDDGNLAGFVHCGASGSGHFVKMTQNAIEYGMMQAFAEGFHLLENGAKCHPAFDFQLDEIAAAGRHGSVVSSWLLELAASGLARDPSLSSFQGVVPDSGTGRWAVLAGLDSATPMNVISSALMQRFDSRIEGGSFGNKVLSVLRAEFGGHTEQQS